MIFFSIDVVVRIYEVVICVYCKNQVIKWENELFRVRANCWGSNNYKSPRVNIGVCHVVIRHAMWRSDRVVSFKSSPIVEVSWWWWYQSNLLGRMGWAHLGSIDEPTIRAQDVNTWIVVVIRISVSDHQI